MDISKIKTNNDIPTDETLIELIKQVILKKKPFYKALIKFEGIRPFSDYLP